MRVYLFLLISFCRILISYEYELSVAAIFKDEAPYLQEWIEYHKMMGVQHFRLYNNDSTDAYEYVLAPYIERGEVELLDWPSSAQDLKNWCHNTQWPQCQDAVRSFMGKSKWLALIDIDEYLFPLEHSTMTEFLKEYEQYPAVMLNWQCFGTSCVKEIPKERLMVEMLHMKAREKSVRNFPVKSIVRPELVDLKQNNWSPHVFNYFSDKPAVWRD